MRLTLAALVFFIALGFAAAADIVQNDYEFSEYDRHPRMEEEDRLRGRRFQYRPGLEIITDVDDCRVELFEENAGRTPWERDNLPSGAYRIRLRRTGYDDVEFWVNLRSDRRTVVLVTMGAAQGRLILAELPPEAQVFIDRRPYQGSEMTITSGRRSLSVRAFGWETVTETVSIESGEDLPWTYQGKPLPFAISTLRITPSTLPPEDRMGFRLNWEADAPGIALLQILDRDNQILYQDQLPVQEASGSRWLVPGALEHPLDDGPYRIIVKTEESQHQVNVTIDSRFSRGGRSLGTGMPGLGFAPTASMLPSGSWQASTSLGSSWTTGENWILPFLAGIRFSPISYGEFGARFVLVVQDPFDLTSMGFTAYGSWRFSQGNGTFRGNLTTSFTYEGYALNFGYGPDETWTPSTPGLTLTGVFEWRWGAWAVAVSPSMTMTFREDDGKGLRFAGSPLFLAGTGLAVSHESPMGLLGFSATAKSPSFPSSDLDWIGWAGIDGRLNLADGRAYASFSAGSRFDKERLGWLVSVSFGLVG